MKTFHNPTFSGKSGGDNGNSNLELILHDHRQIRRDSESFKSDLFYDVENDEGMGLILNEDRKRRRAAQINMAQSNIMEKDMEQATKLDLSSIVQTTHTDGLPAENEHNHNQSGHFLSAGPGHQACR